MPQTMPKTFAVTRTEGGCWEPFIEHRRPPNHEGWKVHAIMFEDGSVWDASNGWRCTSRMTPDELRGLWSKAEAMKAYLDAKYDKGR